VLKLNTQQFAAVFEGLRNAGQSAGNEKRQSTRMEVQAKIRLALLVDVNGVDSVGRVFSGLTRDISACGLGLFQFLPLNPGIRFLVCLPDGKSEMGIVVTSRFCRALAEGVYGVGAEFETIAGTNLMQQLRGDKVQDAAVDRIRNSILR
jgi:hypothetical protein